MKYGLLTLLLVFVGGLTSNAQDTPQNPSLDGKSITYTYQELGTVRLDFMDGLVQFEWLKGPNAGYKGQDFPYKVKKVGPKTYLLNWMEKESSSLVTLFVNLKKSEIHSSAIISPGTEKEMVIWDSATIMDTNIR